MAAIQGSTPLNVSQNLGGFFSDIGKNLSTGSTTFLNRAGNAINRYISANPATGFVLGAGGVGGPWAG